MMGGETESETLDPTTVEEIAQIDRKKQILEAKNNYLTAVSTLKNSEAGETKQKIVRQKDIVDSMENYLKSYKTLLDNAVDLANLKVTSEKEMVDTKSEDKVIDSDKKEMKDED